MMLAKHSKIRGKWQSNTNVKKKWTPTQTHYFFFTSQKIQVENEKKTNKPTNKKENTEWGQHISVQSCYFLVVLRIRAILCLWASVVQAFLNGRISSEP